MAALFLWLSWLTPLHFLPWVSWHNEIPSFFAVFLLAWYGLLSKIKDDQSDLVSIPITVVPLVFLGLVVVVQSAGGRIAFFGDAFVWVLYIALCVMCVTLGYSSRSQASTGGSEVPPGGNENRALNLLAFTLIAGAVASAVVAFAQVFELWEHSNWIGRMPYLRRPGANLGQSNQLATLLLMGMASLVFFYESGRLSGWPAALFFLILGFALSITESRTGILSFLLLLTWWAVKRKRIEFRISSRVVAMAGVGFLVLVLSWPAIFNFIQQSTEVGAEINTKPGLRLVVWPQLLEAVLQRPWWGWGLGGVSKAHNNIAHGHAVSEPYSYSHNILLDLTLGMGFPLTLLLVLISGVWLWGRTRDANQLLPWYCLALTLPVAVHSMLEFPFAYAYFLLPVMFVFGVLGARSGEKVLCRIGVRFAAVLLLGLSLMAAWSVVEYVAAEEDFRIARFEALRVGQTPPDYRKPNLVLLTQLSALLDGARLLPRPGMSADELSLVKKVALRYPWTATQNRYALSLALNGRTEEAMRQLRVMRAMHGEKTYGEIKANWNSLAQDKYPQLRELKLP